MISPLNCFALKEKKLKCYTQTRYKPLLSWEAAQEVLDDVGLMTYTTKDPRTEQEYQLSIQYKSTMQYVYALRRVSFGAVGTFTYRDLSDLMFREVYNNGDKHLPYDDMLAEILEQAETAIFSPMQIFFHHLLSDVKPTYKV